jgi:NAD(P)H-dependent flavin oxidoreductase YrpB (nitropropane dioxygenase family)
VQTVRHALAAERAGADAVCIMGMEGAGLKSPALLPTFVSIPLAAKQVTIPLIAAGGIGDARTLLGALALGADAVLLGSVFCAVKESPLSERQKRVLVEADPYDPKWRDPVLSTPERKELKAVQDAEGTRAIMRAAGKAENFGIPKSAGTGTISLAIGFIEEVITAGELIEGIFAEAENIITTQGIGGWKRSPHDLGPGAKE